MRKMNWVLGSHVMDLMFPDCAWVCNLRMSAAVEPGELSGGFTMLTPELLPHACPSLTQRPHRADPRGQRVSAF